MAIYKNISSDTTSSPVTLITKGSSGGNIRKITIANHDDSDSNIINLHLYDGSSTFVLIETVIPARATLILTDNLSFDVSIYNLRITTSSTADTTITIQ